MIWGGSRGKTFCPSRGRFWLPEMMVSIGYAFMFVYGSISGEGEEEATHPPCLVSRCS